MDNLKLVRRMILCKKITSKQGKVCYGNSFNIIRDSDGSLYAVCSKCNHKHSEISLNI